MGFFDTLRMQPGGIIVADNIVSHSLYDYVAHVRNRPGAQSITLEIGKGLEVTRVHLQ
jgi:predicted O-methyltransferase YrrM